MPSLIFRGYKYKKYINNPQKAWPYARYGGQARQQFWRLRDRRTVKTAENFEQACPGKEKVMLELMKKDNGTSSIIL